jgi:hypothetical protein
VFWRSRYKERGEGQPHALEEESAPPKQRLSRKEVSRSEGLSRFFSFFPASHEKL